MKSCPFITIARSVAADQVVSHGACQAEDCALWNSRTEECSFVSLSDSVDMLNAAVLASSEGLKDLEYTLSPRSPGR